MKSFISYLATLLLSISVSGQQNQELLNATDFKQLALELRSLKVLMGKDIVDHTEAIQLELDIRRQVDNIYLDMNTRLPDGVLTPQSKNFTRELADSLKPYEDIILDTAYRPRVEEDRKMSQLNRLTFNADQLIGFFKPDLEAELLMRKKLVQYPNLRWQIYRHLHELRLLKGSDVKNMEELWASISDQGEKVKWAEEVSFYGSDAGLRVFKELLSVPFDPTGAKNERGEPETNQSFLNYSPALNGIVNLGTKAGELLPLLEAREKEMRDFYISNFGEEDSHRFLVGFEMFKMVLNGKMPTRKDSARNRSGLLFPPGQGLEIQNSNTREAIQSESEFVIRDSRKSNSEKVDKITFFGSSKQLGWPVYLFGALMVFMLTVLWKFRVGSPKL